MLASGEFTGNKRAVFPYLLASKEGQEVYLPDCVPVGFQLGDPDHLTGFKISNLYHHWIGRQKKKLPPFVVLHPGPLHKIVEKKSAKARGKEKVYDPVDTSEDDDGVGGGSAENENEREGDVDEDGDAGENGDVDKDEDSALLPPKFGPPRRKQPPSSRPEESPPVAGSSKDIQKSRSRKGVPRSHGKLAAEKTAESKLKRVSNYLLTFLSSWI